MLNNKFDVIYKHFVTIMIFFIQPLLKDSTTGQQAHLGAFGGWAQWTSLIPGCLGTSWNLWKLDTMDLVDSRMTPGWQPMLDQVPAFKIQ